MTATHQAVERAVADVPGVALATVVVSERTGRGRLRIRLEPDQDASAVSRAVSAVLREQFDIDIDPAHIRPRPASGPEQEADSGAVDRASSNGNGRDVSLASAGSVARSDAPPLSAAVGPAPSTPAGAATAADGLASVEPLRASHDDPVTVTRRHTLMDGPAGEHVGRRRVALTDLTTTSKRLEVEVEVVLELDGRSARGTVQAAAIASARLRAIAEATLAALEELCGERLRTSVERIELVPDGDDEHVTVVVSMLTEDDQDHVVGASLVRGDVEQAVARAALDAVNRRTTPLLLASA